MNTEQYSYSWAIFNRTLQTIEEHQNEWSAEKGRTIKQALNWWDRLPEMAKENLRMHSFEGKETFNTVFDFYWGE